MKAYIDEIFRERVVDSFAGGGGASVGIELALGRPVDIAINHDPDAIAMHKVNHPLTQHYQEDVFAVDPVKATSGMPVGILWASPDCKHFSRAKGGTPVNKKIRGLSWVVLKWAMSKVAPRIILMENVPEIQTWGPLIEKDGELYPDKARAGETFKGFIAMLSNGIDKNHPALAEACEFLKIKADGAEAQKLINGLGYAVEWRELKACDYGAPTIRKRFYMVARNDGKPIVFSAPTHGNKKGLKPYRTAAECIDWNLPCPSIFGRKKDLAINTQRRIARGLDKFVLKNPRPFIMEMNYQNTAQDPLKPMTTQTSANHHYLITPEFVRIGQTGSKNRASAVNDPLRTVCVKNEHCLATPLLSQLNHSKSDKSGWKVNEPTATLTAKNGTALTMPSLIQYHSETSKSEVRGQKPNEPIMTIDGSPRYGLQSAYLSKYFSGEKQAGADIQEPAPTVTGIDHNALVAANIVHYYSGADHACKADTPLPTITTKPRHYLTESHLCVLRNNMDCKDLREPMPTLTTSAGHMAQIKTYLQKIDTTQDLRNWAKVRALLNDYAGYNIADDEILILEIDGAQYFIADIGMRMLKARELMLAQGFPEDYVIDIEQHIGKKYSEAKQIARIGNSVCPPVATALVRANAAYMIATRELTTVKELNDYMLAS